VFDPAGDAVVVASGAAGRQVLMVTPAGQVRAIAADRTLTGQPVQALALSRDGARVAAVVGPPGAGRLVIGRVGTRSGGPAFDGFRDVLPGTPDVRGVSWASGDSVVTTDATASGRQAVEVDVDGYAVRTLPTSGLPAAPIDVAVAPDLPLVVATGASVWLRTGVQWHRVGSGQAPAYPG
jgi:hypothetical protein